MKQPKIVLPLRNQVPNIILGPVQVLDEVLRIRVYVVIAFNATYVIFELKLGLTELLEQRTV